jgi:histidinol-phosphate aminotransferase
VYPPYSAALAACAAHFGVVPDQVALVDGLDEGIMAAAIVLARPTPGSDVPEVIVPEPAFEIFAFDSDVVGGRVVRVAPRPDFSFALDGVLAAITPRTRIVFVTNPNNPTGISVPAEAIRAVSRALPPDAIVFLDEAYADFAGTTFIPQLAAYPNVVVGRTFSKAYGLAGLRIGALIGMPGTLAPLRRAIGVYSVNLAAAVALPAALSDREHIARYLEDVDTSKTLVYAACDRLGLEYWRSDANFVLVRTGARTADFVSAADEAGIYLRDRSGEPGCDGTVRITTGIVEHTRRALAVLDEVLCAAR